MACKQKTYPNQTTAEIKAEMVLKEYGTEMIAYCCEKCGYWHLSPADRHTPQKHCGYCAKSAYETKEYAERRARIIYKEQKKQLKVYQCSFGNGWHLTSQC